MHRLVTFLGIGSYQPVRYAFAGEKPAPETRWIARALNWILEPQPDETVVVATDRAWTCHGDRLCDAFRSSGLALPRRVTIPDGRTAAELWQQFEALKRELRGHSNDRITVDITHALRHQPFFAAGIISFIRMVDPSSPTVRVVYGAFELRGSNDVENGTAPIVDLTPFVELVDWTHDITLFLKTGRVAGLAERSKTLGAELRKSWAMAGREGDEPRLRELAEAIEAFARDLQTIRTGALLLGSAEKGRSSPARARSLLAAIAAARSDVVEHLPPLADVLDRIEAMARRLDFDGHVLMGPEAKRVLANLADLYLSMGRYAEAITTLREGRITAFAAPAAACPGQPRFDEGERALTEYRFWHEAERDEARSMADIRNDIDHAGYRAEPLSANDLIDNICNQRKAFDELAFEAAPHAERALVNITNHPLTDWSSEQLTAAKSLADRVVDLPFPDANPHWTVRRIEKEADDLLGRLPPETTHALVQGEFTLTMALVKKLQEKGIRCLAATTERKVEKTEDGREVRAFRFVRFREYPKLA